MRLALPAPLAERPPIPFPWMGAIAPVLAAGVLFAITRSPLSLAFAALGPVMAVAALVDGRVSGRRAARLAAAARADALAQLSVDVAAEHAALRLRWAATAPTARELLELDSLPPVAEGRSPSLRLGTGTVPSGIDLAAAAVADRPIAEHAARVPDAPVVVDAQGGIGIVGQPALAEALARALEVQLLWLGHGRGGAAGGLIRRGGSAAELAPACEVLVEIDGPTRAHLIGSADEFVPELLSGAEIARFRRRAVASASEPPTRLAFAALPGRGEADGTERGPASGLAARFAATASGALELDLVADGPHAVVAGTTGSGKSDLLVSWLLAMAASHPSDRLGMLLFDFKGGASFDRLDGLPHVRGIVTDLDGPMIDRATAGLAAEMRRREHLLRERRARSVDDCPDLARLVIVVDEFAVLLGANDRMHALFTDIAARGRSLGMHLILCTQRPSGVMRDSLLANFGLRISLRVVDSADSSAVIGTPAAAAIPRALPGRCWVALHGEPPIEAQVALVSVADAAAVATEARMLGATPAEIAWLPPLPERLDLASLLREPEAAGLHHPAVLLGLGDLPEEGRQPPAVWEPTRDGGLAVVGSPGSGRSTAAATIAHQLGVPVLAGGGPTGAETLWDALTDEGTEPLVIDDLDAAFDALSDEHSAVVPELFAAMLRRRRRAVVVTATSPVGGGSRSIAAQLGATLVLRVSSRDEHVLAGAPGALFDPRIGAGAGVWRGARVQVALAGAVPMRHGAVPTRHGAAPDVGFARGSVTCLVTTTPGDRLTSLARMPSLLAIDARGLGPQEIGAALIVDPGTAVVLVADPETWQRSSPLWALVTTLACVYDRCTVSQFRLVSGQRTLPPALIPGNDRVWVVRPEQPVTRGVLVTDAGRDPAG
ncbi:FtsK/SpoIIIE domain-containing protein [Amnibacterium flavum]|uniref:FtsK domain-containing protein n=1 Tax=Amnibacterium flavum TaxID=2173173 RepID=A0A2V1HXW8_9MICO|nr:FtsK/SpoIIIE domain-containing protein [Amnibacterium flavum]PVZ96239.1 hypothetical protein DDQ50_07440 [Amnibacterium flavum]